MNKADFIQRVADRSGLSRSQVGAVVDAIFNAENGVITEALRKGESVSFTGFGSFKAGERAARKGRNPQTGKEIDIPASRSASFAAGRGLKDALNDR